MKRLKFVILILVAGVFCTSPSRATAQQYAKPGNFDFYLFTLSWSPQFCATTRRETSGVRDAWREFRRPWALAGVQERLLAGELFERARSRESKCRGRHHADASLVDHEWQKHGTCSGLGVDGYFDLMRSIRKSIIDSGSLLHLKETQMMAAAEIKAEFVAANPRISTEDMVIGCANNTLVQVQFCVAKDGTPTDVRHDTRLPRDQDQGTAGSALNAAAAHRRSRTSDHRHCHHRGTAADKVAYFDITGTGESPSNIADRVPGPVYLSRAQAMQDYPFVSRTICLRVEETLWKFSKTFVMHYASLPKRLDLRRRPFSPWRWGSGRPRRSSLWCMRSC